MHPERVGMHGFAYNSMLPELPVARICLLSNIALKGAALHRGSIQQLENVDQIHLVLASGKPVLQKRFSFLCFCRTWPHFKGVT